MKGVSKMTNQSNQIFLSDSEQQTAWEQLKGLVSSEYTLTIRQICRILKCNRSWVSRYVSPHLNFIKVSNGFGRNNKRCNDYTKMLGFETDKSMIRFSEEQFIDLIKSHIVKSTRQTISIPIECLVKEERINDFKKAYVEIEANISKFRMRLMSALKLREEIEKKEKIMNECYLDIFEKISRIQDFSKRNQIQSVDYHIMNFDVKKLIAPHDLMNYGDSSEMIYRNFFNQGLVRIVISIPDVNGEMSKKIYYYDTKNDIETRHTSPVAYVTIAYADFLKYKSDLNM